MTKPKLLLPAGSVAAFNAALDAGCDEIYLGTKDFNARMGAENFSIEEVAACIKRAHFFGVKVFVTLNTLVSDRELPRAIKTAEELYLSDCDGLILADAGLAASIRARFPDFALHASTQMSAHNAEAVKLLKARGFSRVVLARECSLENIVKIRKAVPDMEYEIFIHGALCVSHSGQCLYSACLGDRSANRGTCAQCCRLPDKDGGYPLSLKDNCLARLMPEVISSGAFSLKVEGRMKSPEYVYGVGSIYRRLIDEERRATEEELCTLEELFSRSGFTDAYFRGLPDRTMLGVRTEDDKAKTPEAETTAAFRMKQNPRKLPVSISATFAIGQISSLTMACKGESVTVYGTVPDEAKTSPLQTADVVKNLCKLGATPFKPDKDSFSLYLDKGASLPISAVNSLRRTASERLEEKLNRPSYPERVRPPYEPSTLSDAERPRGGAMIAHFTHASKMPSRLYLGQFSEIYLPVSEYLKASDAQKAVTVGVELPPVVMQNELDTVEEMLIRAKLCGIKKAYVQNVGTLRLALKYGFTVTAGVLMNVYNSKTAEVLKREGVSSVVMSPELNTAQLRALAADCPVTPGAVIYGKLPMMILEKCIIRDIDGLGSSVPIPKCRHCESKDYTYLCDREGIEHPVRREFIHRNVLYNGVPIYMADKIESVMGGIIGDMHFFFTDESAHLAGEVIDAYKEKKPPVGRIRRI